MDGDSTIFPWWVVALVWVGAFVLWGKYLDYRERKKHDRDKRNAG